MVSKQANILQILFLVHLSQSLLAFSHSLLSLALIANIIFLIFLENKGAIWMKLGTKHLSWWWFKFVKEMTTSVFNVW